MNQIIICKGVLTRTYGSCIKLILFFNKKLSIPKQQWHLHDQEFLYGSIFIINKNISENTITIQTLIERKEKKINLHLFETKKLKFFENEIDP